jgi:hypothetical protein
MNAGISPSKLEANLGILPIDIYTTPQYTDIFPGAICHTVSGTTPQTCVRQVLANWKAQGVTGVRFQFALGNGQWQAAADGSGPFYSSYSTPFDASGGLTASWNSNLAAFFADVKAAGISDITPYTVMSYYWSGWGNPTFETVHTVVDGCTSTPQTFYFYPWLPFGLVRSSGFLLASWPDQDMNYAYYCTPANPTFWGWTPYLNLVGEIAGDASGAGLNIEEFEIEAEMNLFDYTATARLLYDNLSNTPVLADVGNVLASYGFSAGAATYSVSTTNPSVAAYDCGSVYGDSALVLSSSELLAAMGGGLIGYPDSPALTNNLWCGGTAPGSMIYIPTSPLPAITDNHVYPCIGSCGSSPDVTTTAQTEYADIYWFHYYRGLLGGSAVMIGETSSNSATWAGYGCDGTDGALAAENANGFTSSLLYSSYGAYTTLRPWDWITSVSPLLCETPGTIGAPWGPYAP